MTEFAALQPYVDALGWMLIHFLWQGCVIAGAYWIVCKLSRPGSVQLRYWSGLAAYLATAIVPLLTFLVHLRPAGRETALAVTGLPAMTITTGYHLSAGELLQQSLEPALPVVVLLWALGVSLLSSRTFIGWMGTRRMTRVGVEPVSDDILAAAQRLQQRLGLTRAVQVLHSVLVTVPTVIGWLKPVILLPASVVAELPRGQLEMIIAHELAHVRRNDYLVNLFQVMIETIFFYHPGVRWMSRQVSQEREHCCDDLVVAQCGQPVQYARALASLEALRDTPMAPALGATGGDLFQRVSRIVRAETPRRSSGHVQLALTLGVAVIASLGTHQGLESGLRMNLPAGPALEAVTTINDAPPVMGEGWRNHSIDRRVAIENEKAEILRRQAELKEQKQKLAESVAMAASLSAEQPPAAPHFTQPESSALEFIDARIAIEIEPLDYQLANAKPLPPVAEPGDPKKGLMTARPIKTKAPDYPYTAYRDGVEGFVTLEFTVDGRGRTGQVTVVEANPARVFNAAAMRALKKWRFEVGQDHDAELRLVQTFEFNYSATGEKAAKRSRRCNRTGSNICGQHYGQEHTDPFGPSD